MADTSLRAKNGSTRLRVKFNDGIVIHIQENNTGFKVTTSSPLLMADFKRKGEAAQAFSKISKINKSKFCISDLCSMAEKADSIIELAQSIKS